MLTVDDYGRIRRACRDGMSLRAIAQQFHHTWRKVKQAVAEPEPRPYTRSKPPVAPKLGPFTAQIDEILATDEQAPPKQRHTAMRVFYRLQQAGYSGGYDQVRRYIARHRRCQRETFIPLSHEPGQRAEADFGHVYVDFPHGRQQVPVLVVAWAWSYCPFYLALPTERTEAILHGLVEAFTFFDCVPHELWWDNPSTVAVEVLRGRTRRLNERYAALASHYNFEPLFCLPARGNEKPHAENRVKDLERRWATPVPQMADLTAFNAYLRQCCLEDRGRVATGQTESIGARFEQDRAAALRLPARAFDPCIARPAVVDKYQTVQFDNSRYSVPRCWAFQTVTVKGYVERIEVVAGGQVVARHERLYQRGGQVLDPLHYLVTLSRKPACLDHAAVYRQWKLPPVFAELRQELETVHGPTAGARQYTRVLLLLAEHPVQRVERAIVFCCRGAGPLVEQIVRRTGQLAEAEWERPATAEAGGLSAAVPEVRIPRPDLSRFDQLLFPGEPQDAHHSSLAVEGQLEAVAVAEHGCRV